MQANLFYQSGVENAIPLILLNQTECEENSFENLSEFERNCLNTRQFKGMLGDIVILDNADGLPCKVYVGSGENQKIQALAIAAIRLPKGCYLAPNALEKPAILVWSLAQYGFDRYKDIAITPKILAVDLSILPTILIESESIFLVRDLINTPANDLGPEQMSLVVAELAHHYGAEFQQWVGDELIHNNFPAIHAVGRAAAEAPRLLSLTWGNKKHPLVTLIGKGVCFDSGGLDIKPSSGMRLMKKDMGGAAQVIGLAKLLMAQSVPIRLQVLIPTVENAIGSKAYRPGDVLTMRNGLTVEIDNTDAEGRLILADAIAKACEEKPALLIDFATLTGAARVSVGTEISAMFTNDDALAQDMMTSAAETCDPVWRMPLFAGYSSMLDSSVADMVNSANSPYAGAITAALFLQRFIPDEISWAHFDVMAWNVGNKPGRPEGGEAMGMLAVADYLKKRF